MIRQRLGAGTNRPLACLLVAVFAAVVAFHPSNSRADSDHLLPLKRVVVTQYAVVAAAVYDDAVIGARGLLSAIERFLANPTDGTLAEARASWIAARTPYVQSEVYRFADGPIDAVEGYINAWPIDEQLIDYVDGDPTSGVINRPADFPAITRDLLIKLNEKDGEKSISTGFHAIEFLLWGQDLNDGGPGNRSARDYVIGASEHAERRRAYLLTAAQLLAAHLEQVATEWSMPPGPPGLPVPPGAPVAPVLPVPPGLPAANYRARLMTMPPDEALTIMLKGAGMLSGAELAGERLTVAYETKEQEDEHSCFSDTTHLDVLHDAMGIGNVVTGSYTRISGERIAGPGLADLLAKVEPTLAETMTRQVAASIDAARSIPAPFDRAIVGRDGAPGRVAVRQVIAALRAQTLSIAEAGAALGLRLNF